MTEEHRYNSLETRGTIRAAYRCKTTDNDRTVNMHRSLLSSSHPSVSLMFETGSAWIGARLNI